MSRRTRFAAALTALCWGVGTAGAHVKYVTEETANEDPLGFLLGALSEPLNLALLVGGGVGAVGVVAGYLWFRPLRADFRAARRALRSYRDLVPWMLRLALGLPLVGAGYNGYLFSPVVTLPGAEVAVRLFGIGVGFLLLFGLATRLVALAGLAGYLVALAAAPARVMLAFEYLPGFVAIILAGGGRPSADHMIHRMADDDRTLYSDLDPLHTRLVEPFRRRIEPYASLFPTVVRVGMGVAFVYLGLAEKLLAPGQAMAVVAKYDLTAVVPVSPELWVVGAGLTEIAVGLVLIAGFLTRGAAAVAFVLFTTTLFGLPDDPVLAHVSLFGLASVLMVTGSGPLALDRWLEYAPSRHGAQTGTDPAD
jgi:uncharacterized membrane protein YphA (DoxX/SURF4 family)